MCCVEVPVRFSALSFYVLSIKYVVVQFRNYIYIYIYIYGRYERDHDGQFGGLVRFQQVGFLNEKEMEKNEKYIVPECEEINVKTESGILFGSNEGVGGNEED